MKYRISEIIPDLELFCTEGDYLERLRLLADRVLDSDNPEAALVPMLKIFERYPDEELGSPGPLVHAIEKCRGYEEALLASLERQPTTLTVWMVHRLYKKKGDPRLIAVLERAASHPKASEMVKEDAAILILWLKEEA